MTNNNDIVQDLYIERIEDDFRTYCQEEYKDYLDEQLYDNEAELWQEFKEKALQDLYNSDDIEPFCQSYSHLVFFLGMCIPQSEWFTDWNKPQKVYQLGLYLLAEEYIMGLEPDDYIKEGL
jgi:hypothetical protein